MAKSFVDGIPTTVEVWEDYLDGEWVAWVSHFKPLGLLAQGATKEEAVDALRVALMSWAAITTEKFDVEVRPDRAYQSVPIQNAALWKPK